MNAVERCGFKPNTGVYYITGKYPCENYDTGVIKCLFQPRPDSDAVWAVLSVFPMATLNKPTTEIFHTSDEVKAAIQTRRDEMRTKYYAEAGETLAELAKFMVTHDCGTGSDPIARSVALDKLEHFGIEILD